MIEFFEILIADFQTSPLLTSLSLATLFVLLTIAAKMLSGILGLTRTQRIQVFCGLGVILTCYLSLCVSFRQDYLEKFSPQSFNAALSTTLQDFKGVGNCRKDGMHLKGTFKTTVSVREGEFPVHVPVDMLVRESDICNYGFVPRPAYIQQDLQQAAANYLNKNAESVQRDISKILKPKPVEVEEVGLATGLKVEVAKTLLTPSVAVEPQEPTPNARVDRKFNVNTSISGQ